jgi:anti-sigma factor RsiW
VAAAAAVAAFVAGAAAGWVAHSASAPAASPLELLNSEALSAHKLYIAEVRHPIEVRAGEQHLLPWLSRRVGTSLRAPDLESYSLKLLGGRLLPGPIGPAALFMYETPSGERYTFYCSKSPAPRTALRYHATEGVAAVQWVESDIGFVVSGPANRDRLLQIAQTAYEQMDIRPPATRSSQLLLSGRAM